MIKYLYDDEGNKTDIIIPIKKWNDINTLNHELRRFSIEEKNDNYDLIDLISNHAIFKQHYIEILSLLNLYIAFKNHNMIIHDPKNQLLKTYKEYFKYYEILDQNDINLLYFFRTSVFKGFSILDEVSVYCEKLYQKYELTDYNGKKINFLNYAELIERFNTLTEFAFLQYFKIYYRINLPDSKNKRLNRESECNRLFIYDMLTLNQKHAGSLNAIMDFWPIIQDKSTLIEILSLIFYKNTKTRVHRAYKEAKDRILHNTI